jgi:hypothetical protein
MHKESVDHHFNPCFWTAHWNFSYLEAVRQQRKTSGRARQQKVCVWKLKPDKIIFSKTEDCFYEKNANNTIIFHDQIAALINNFSSGNNLQTHGIDENSTVASFNIENLFSTIEGLYQNTLIETIRTGQINDLATKTMLSFFIFSQSIRNPSAWNYLKGSFLNNKNNTDDDGNIFNMFVKFRKALEDRERIMSFIIPFLSVKWVLFKVNRYTFPLSDHPLLFLKEKLILPLAPDLLLEIYLNEPVDVASAPCTYRYRLGYTRYNQYKRATIAHAKDEMVFGQDKFFFKNRINYLVGLY